MNIFIKDNLEMDINGENLLNLKMEFILKVNIDKINIMDRYINMIKIKI